jgi:hypothetical protein
MVRRKGKKNSKTTRRIKTDEDISYSIVRCYCRTRSAGERDAQGSCEKTEGHFSASQSFYRNHSKGDIIDKDINEHEEVEGYEC